ncbi:MAG: branched-chain amino acid transaminase [Saprospiraceae bacterium]|nr:branched-chain amino acid transaminase [Saprospiraceae bacterium]
MYFNDQTIVFLDGQWIKAKDAQAGLYAQTLHYGNGVFEGIRAYHTKEGAHIFAAGEHFKRLHYSASRMQIALPYSEEELTQIAYQLLEKNGLSDAYIRPLVFTGANMSLTTPEESHVFLCAWRWGKLLGDQLVHVMTSSFCRPHPKSCFIDAKVVGHYTNSILATTEARQKGFDEALLLDVDGFVSEGPGANFFVERQGVLYTPPLGSILPGITRRHVLDICQKAGIPVRQERFTPETVHGADGAFFVGTAAEVTGLASLDHKKFRRAWKNTFGAAIQSLYKARVLKEDNKEAFI